MLKRNLRIARRVRNIPVLGICEFCNAQFHANLHPRSQRAEAQAAIQQQFNVHKCKPEDASQAAVGQFTMESEPLHLFLISSHDNASSPGYQRELREFEQALKLQGLDVPPRDSISLGSLVGGTGAGIGLASEILSGAFDIKLVASLSTALGTVIGGWLHARYGRKAHGNWRDRSRSADS